MKRSLIVFAKEPKEGVVKTRLNNVLSQSVCTNLYKAFLRDVVSLAGLAACEEKILCYDSRGEHPVFLKRIAPSFKFLRQEGADLGSRIESAFVHASLFGADKIAIIGSDVPDLPPEYIDKAFLKLDKNDLVIGPSSDGGYYLIAMKDPCLSLFRDIKWSSSRVLKDTLKNASRIKMKTHLLREWHDVDTPESLSSLRSRLAGARNYETAPWTRRFLKI